MSLILCINNQGYEASLENRKLYQRIADVKADKLGFFRVLDESGDSYLYHKKHFYQLSTHSDNEFSTVLEIA